MCDVKHIQYNDATCLFHVISNQVRLSSNFNLTDSSRICSLFDNCTSNSTCECILFTTIMFHLFLYTRAEQTLHFKHPHFLRRCYPFQLVGKAERADFLHVLQNMHSIQSKANNRYIRYVGAKVHLHVRQLLVLADKIIHVRHTVWKSLYFTRCSPSFN